MSGGLDECITIIECLFLKSPSGSKDPLTFFSVAGFDVLTLSSIKDPAAFLYLFCLGMDSYGLV
jgi:hypothetical protein